jgi:hypothetical protein
MINHLCDAFDAPRVPARRPTPWKIHAVENASNTESKRQASYVSGSGSSSTSTPAPQASQTKTITLAQLL